jgi:drug/metabolite transporter (DMT)-like permease
VAIGVAYMLGVVVLWSIVPVLIKLLLPVFDPYTIAFLRLSQATGMVLAACLLRGRHLRQIQLSWWHVAGGLGVALNYALFALSLSFTTATAGVLVVQIQYVTLAVLAAVVLHERLGAGKIAGILLVLAGVALIVALRSDVDHLVAPRYALGNLLMLFSGVGWGVYALSNKALAHRMGALAALLPMLAIATAITGALATAGFELHSSPTATDLVVVLVLGTAATGAAFILISKAMGRLSAALAGTLTGITPVTQIMVAHLALDEPLSENLAAGGTLILGGVLAMVLAERRGKRFRDAYSRSCVKRRMDVSTTDSGSSE